MTLVYPKGRNSMLHQEIVDWNIKMYMTKLLYSLTHASRFYSVKLSNSYSETVRQLGSIPKAILIQYSPSSIGHNLCKRGSDDPKRTVEQKYTYGNRCTGKSKDNSKVFLSHPSRLPMKAL